MRHIEITAEMAARIEKLNPGSDITKLIAFESIALNQLPIRKRHFLYEGAVHEPSVLYAMADRASREPVPLYAEHNSFDSALGYVFHAAVLGNELRSQFAIDIGEEEFVRKVQNGTYGQVSVSNKAEKALCSECGWDYFGEEATFDNIYGGVCGNGHKLREDGVHLRLHGLDEWFELSLVVVGGSQGARIVAPGAAKLSANHSKVLAAKNSQDKLPLILTGSADLSQSQSSSKEKNTMDEKELLGKFEAKIEEAATLKADKTRLTVEKDALDTDLKAANDKVEKLEAEVKELKANPDEKVANLTKERDDLKGKVEKHDEALKSIRALVTKLSVMAGDSEFKADEADFEALTAKFDEYNENLKKIVLDGASKSADTKTNENADASGPSGAFRIAR